MTQYSYSRVSLFEDCPYHFKLRYIDKLTEIPDITNAANPLIIGNALHTGIEHDVETAINEYYNSFPVLTDRMVEEAMKLEILIPKVKEYLETNFEGMEFIHEYEIDKPGFKGYVDLILIAPGGTCMVMDFKYSNNIKNYLDSGQLHIYKHYLEQDGFNVKKLAYLFVPKTSIKQEKDEDLFHFRKRIVGEVEKSEVKFVPIEFDNMNIIYFQNNIKKIETAKEYPKNVSGNCFSCNPRFAPNYLEAIYNEKGEIELVLPKNERRERKIDTKPDFWIYGDSYVGKSTFVDHVENVLFLNTDGNTDNTTAPVIPIKDVAKKEGRRTVRTLAWEKLLEVIEALETDETDYEAVAIDLVEDLYEHCRVYVYDKNGWEHESDGNYGKGWDKVRTEWQNTIKRLKALGYQVIYISKELRDDITLKGGSKRTTFKPNINDKVANFLTGTVDLTMRAFSNSDDERFLQLAKKSSVFGGGRFDFGVETCSLNMDEFLTELTAAQEGKATKKKDKRSSRFLREEEPAEESTKRERKNRSKKEENVATKTMYFVHEGSDEPLIVKKGESLDFLDGDIFDPISKAEYEKLKAEFDETAEPSTDEKPKRKSRNSDDDTEEKPRTRKRRERTPVDDVPPGEEESTDEPPVEEETPRRRRRTLI